VTGNVNTSGNLLISNSVGIGTTSPASYGKFAVFGTQPVASVGNVSGFFSDGATVSLYVTNQSAVATLRSDGTLAFGSGSSVTERMRITTAGSVGIGTTTPTSTLDVEGGTRTYGIANFDGATFFAQDFKVAGTHKGYLASANAVISGGSINDVALDASVGNLILATGDAEKVRITSAGAVGIGTTTPAAPLQVGPTSAGAINGYTKFIVDSSDYAVATFKCPAANFNQIIFTDTTSTGLGGINYFNSSYATPNVMGFNTAGSERMRIDASGNMGIGTAVNTVFDAVADLRPLVVQKSDASTTLNGSTAAITISNGNTTTNNTAQLNFAAITGASTNHFSSAIISAIFGARTNGQYPTGQLVFSTSTSLNSAPSEKMRITSAGLVGIGTSTPSEQLTLASGYVQTGNGIGGAGGVLFPYGGDAGTRTWRVRTDHAAYGDWGVEQSTTRTGTTFATKLLIDPNGNVGIGTSSPAAKLDVEGGTRTYGIANFDGATYFAQDFKVAGTHKGYLASASAIIGGGSANDVALDASAGNLILATGDVERARIDSSGNIQLSTAGTKILNSSGKPILQQTGSVLQVVSTTLNTYGSTGSQNYVLVGGLSVAITPATTTNKVLIRGYIWLSGSTQNGMYGAVFRDGSILAGVAGSAAQPSAIVNGTVGTVTASGGFIPASGYVTYQATPICFEFLDSPASTSSLTYQIGVRVGGGGVVYYNYQSNTGGNPDFGYFASTITAMEIVA
jgi:hypothetical protein